MFFGLCLFELRKYRKLGTSTYQTSMMNKIQDPNLKGTRMLHARQKYKKTCKTGDFRQAMIKIRQNEKSIDFEAGLTFTLIA